VAGVAGFSYQSVAQLKVSATEYMQEKGHTLQQNESKQWVLPNLTGLGDSAASEPASRGNMDSDTFEEIEPINASEIDCQDEEMESEDWSWLVDGSDDEVVTPGAASQTSRKTARSR
jgi:Ran GTPase-activating protein (RanGAP) involved in mRNA processing and transport